MNPYPAVDPIPLPAPVWLMKLLHVVTLSLHFVAVEMLLGGLLLAILLSLFRSSANAHMTARALARRLTIVMTFVINLGVPPLLFAQVLYGRALYTSSVLIGVYWIAIIPTLMLVYWLLYKFSARLDAGQIGLVGGADCVAAGGRRGADALDEYDADAAARGLARNVRRFGHGRVSAHGRSHADAALAADDGGRIVHRRVVAGVSGGAQHLYRGREDIRRRAGRQGGCRFRDCLSGRGTVGGERAAGSGEGGTCAGTAIYPAYRFEGFAGYGWIALVAVAVLVGAIAGFGKIAAGWLSWTAVLAGVLVEIMLTVYRDGVRDVTLLSKGYDVWDRAVVTNWGVVGLFLVLFVASLGVIGWLVSVVARAQKTMEGAA